MSAEEEGCLCGQKNGKEITGTGTRAGLFEVEK